MQQQPDDGGLRFLVVDDSGTARAVLEAFLSRFGECVGVGDGREALRTFHTSVTEGRPFDMIFLDIMMPEMDGMTVLKTIRRIEEEKGWSTVNVVVTTALSDGEQVRAAKSAGAVGYLVKPIQSVKLVEQLRSLQLVPG